MEMLTDRQMGPKPTNEQTELHQFVKEPSYDGDLSPCQLNSIGQTVFELESGSGNVEGHTNGQTNGPNYTNLKRNLAMMVIYLPVKFEFDWTNRFQIRVRKWKF